MGFQILVLALVTIEWIFWETKLKTWLLKGCEAKQTNSKHGIIEDSTDVVRGQSFLRETIEIVVWEASRTSYCNGIWDGTRTTEEL